LEQNPRTLHAVVALAGRRIDAEGTHPPRFPLANVPIVRRRLAELLVSENATAIVCSAACGADLIALEEAERLGIRRRIILPFCPDRFRDSSVVDRPGDWGPLFDRLIAAAGIADDLIVVGETDAEDTAYAAANDAIIREAKQIAEADGTYRLLAVIVWEGEQRAGTDATAAFRELAVKAEFEQESILTL
jgi:hypothetical protein